MRKCKLYSALTVCLGLLFVANIAAAAGAQQDIGRQSINFGSDKQAKALLTLIDDFPNQVNYQITYQSDADVVVFGCDLSTETMARIHQRPNGTGSGENWSGEIMYRLKAAAAGGSLNDTSGGKNPGKYISF